MTKYLIILFIALLPFFSQAQTTYHVASDGSVDSGRTGNFGTLELNKPFFISLYFYFWVSVSVIFFNFLIIVFSIFSNILVSTYSASSFPIFLYDNIIPFVWMPMFAFFFFYHKITSSHINTLCYRFQMFWINTSSISTKMVNYEPFRYCSIKIFKRSPMRRSTSFIVINSTVSILLAYVKWVNPTFGFIKLFRKIINSSNKFIAHFYCKYRYKRAYGIFLFLIFIITFHLNVFATHYYVSATGSDANAGTSTGTAWQTITKVNATTFSAGDIISFNGGDTFYGKIVVSNSGSSGNPITYNSYGTGKATITGFTTVTSWTNKGGNIWESSNAVSTLENVKQVIINGVTVPMGATPNRDTTYPYLPNYYPYQSHTGTGSGATTLTSSSLDGTNWTGADVVVRANHWTMDKESITSSSGTTIGYNGQTAGTDGAGIVDGWGFFIQNDVRTLNQQNEWYYNPKTKKMRIYSTSPPTGVKITAVDTLFYASNKDYITVNNIDFEGANISAVVFSSCDYPTITNCNLSYTGATALEAQNKSNYLLVNNCSFSDLGGAGIWNSDGGTNWVIINNTFKRCDLVSVIKPNDYSNGAIEIVSPNALVQYNYIDSAGYEGIHFRGNNVQIRNNLVNHTTILRDDGGGIYTGFTNETGKIIDGNIVLNSIGNDRGVASGGAAGNGIYLDGLTDDATVTNNTIAHVASAGIFLNNGRLNSVHNNTVYDIGGDNWTKGCLMVQTYNGAPYSGYQRGNNVTNNIFFQKRPEQYCVFFYESSVADTVQEFGMLDSNFYVKATDTNLVLYKKYNVDYAYLNLPTWQATSGQEAHGIAYADNGNIDTSKIKLVYNATKNDSVVSLDAVYKDVKGVSYSGSITIAPYRSAILIYDSPLVTPPPTVSTSGDQTLITNSTTIFSTPVAASGETITGYAWTDITGSGTTTITSPTSQNTGITDLSVGLHTFRITVTQSDGQTAYADVNVTLSAAPTANAGTDKTITLPTSSVILSGSGTVASGQTASYQWTKVSGSGTQTIIDNTTLTPTISGMTIAGDYVFQLKVTQTDTQFATSTVTVHVNAAPQTMKLYLKVPTIVIQLQ